MGKVPRVPGGRGVVQWSQAAPLQAIRDHLQRGFSASSGLLRRGGGTWKYTLAQSRWDSTLSLPQLCTTRPVSIFYLSTWVGCQNLFGPSIILSLSQRSLNLPKFPKLNLKDSLHQLLQNKPASTSRQHSLASDFPSNNIDTRNTSDLIISQ